MKKPKRPSPRRRPHDDGRRETEEYRASVTQAFWTDHMEDVVGAYRQAVAEGMENPVVMIHGKGDLLSGDTIPLDAYCREMGSLERWALSSGYARRIADCVRMHRQPGHFAAFVADRAGFFSVITIPVDFAE